MYVKPTECPVYDPERSMWLPPGGSVVPRTQYWLRRLVDGSVIEADQSSKNTATVTETTDNR